jgi:excisionase family DNA binding protein
MDERNDRRRDPQGRGERDAEADPAPATRTQVSRSRRAPDPHRALPDAGSPLLTANEVAAILRTSRKAVYAMAERAQLPGLTRIGRRLLVRRDDLLSWLDERRAASPKGNRR